ncbi:sensor histidine kinase [Dyella sp. M7H15-1]|uniref:hybrid sensor histidine kinase/response regulator n=1 Tax=Dyella sp. M7H15-1 TaxID=2501295 RepID=UPI001004E592|nr:hybrid sensor histidine kinase/response regulator [Dyella sp. M7H15-1]QAU23032.1 sensor histidine kinase [Dyella sp. M7H15-1]
MEHSQRRQVSNGGMHTDAVPGGRELSALHRHQRRLLYGGGCLLSLLILLAAASSILSGINRYHAQQRAVFQDGQGAMDYFFVQRDRAYASSINASDTLWATRQDLLLQIGAPIARDFLAQGQRALVTASNKVAVPWLTLGRDADGMPSSKLSAYLGLIHEYSAYTATTVDFVQSSGRLTVYAYDPSGELFTVTGFQDEAELLRALKVSTREQAFALLMRSELHGRNMDSVSGKNVQSANDERMVSYYGLNPFNGEPSLIGCTTLMADGSIYLRRISLVPVDNLKQRLVDEASGTFAIFTHEGDMVLETGVSSLFQQADLSSALQNRELWKHPSVAPVLLRQHGIYLVVGSLRGVDWTMVHLYSWRDVVVAERAHATKVAAMLLLILAVLWILLWRMDRRGFAPALEGASRVYESEALNRTIIETSPIGLCLLDPESGHPILQNDMVRRVAGIGDAAETEALLGQLVSHVKTLGDSPTHEFLWMLELPDGHFRHLQVAMSAAHYRHQPIQVCTLRDVTVQAELEENLRRAQHDSEQARVAAESASHAKSHFVATMSHEIRTPLNGVLGHLELLARSSLGPSQRERLGRIRQSADALLAIISDVLDFSRIEAGQLDIDPAPFSLRSLIEQSALLFAPAAQRNGVKLYFAIDTELASTYVSDVHRIRQILNNLLSNAVKFTQSGRIILRVSPGPSTTEAESWLRFQVIDSGIGMNEQQLAQLFQPFAQADASIARRYGGSGLGLALCQQMSQLLGGRIQAESTESVGSVFTLDIPAKAAEVSAEAAKPLLGRHLALLSAAPEWRAEIGSLLTVWGATVTVAALPADWPLNAIHAGDTLVIFGMSGAWNQEDEQVLLSRYEYVIRAYAEGPLVPELRDQAIVVSCYDSQALLSALGMETENAAASVQHVVSEGVAVRGARGRILLAEDNPVNRELIQQQLQELGFDVDAAEHGAAALGKWVNGKYMAVLTDINMPQMDGYELAHALRVHDRELPILAITATALASEKARCREAGISDVLLKPLTLDRLEEVLSRYVPYAPKTEQRIVSGIVTDKVFPLHVRRVFVDRGMSDLVVLRDAMARQDAQGLIDVIHGFKGALLMLGESDAARECSVLESRLHEAGLAAVTSDVSHLQQILLEVVQRYEAGLGESEVPASGG